MTHTRHGQGMKNGSRRKKLTLPKKKYDEIYLFFLGMFIENLI